MIDNPQLLIKNLSGIDISKNLKHSSSLDAVFIPFKHRSCYINEMLSELQWYNGPIYLMPSDDTEMKSIRNSYHKNIHELYVEDAGFIDFFGNLLTTHYKHTSCFYKTWDLPIKRNYALIYSRKKHYERILLVDDDIRALKNHTVTTGANLLDYHAIAGCFVDSFPDLSIMDHLESIAGEQLYPFLSGSFLFLKPFKAIGFFPNIYNEDWLFMLPHVLEQSICSFGSIVQLPYDPFADFTKVAFQEFGDIIVEGLYGLAYSNDYESRFDIKVWQEIINARQKSLELIRNNVEHPIHQKTIEIAIQANAFIAPNDCLEYIDIWEKDIMTWTRFIKEVAWSAIKS